MLEVIFGIIAIGLSFGCYYFWNQLYIIRGKNNQSEIILEMATQERESLMERIEVLGEQVIGMQSQVGFLQDELGSRSSKIDDLITELGQESDKNDEKAVEIKKQKGRAASAHTTKGQILEKWCPFLDHPDIDPDWEAKNWQFMGQPIDYIIFDWRENKEINVADGKIIMLDVKSGGSQLTKKQRRIRDLIEAGNVEWRTIRLV
jgi:predicted Holliday junction resolvase-like endonuclease